MFFSYDGDESIIDFLRDFAISSAASTNFIGSRRACIHSMILFLVMPLNVEALADL